MFDHFIFMYKGFLAHMAVDSRVVVFNVDYRLAPETRFKNEFYLDYSIFQVPQ